MRLKEAFRKMALRGVAWRRLLKWAIYNVPLYLEPLVIATWCALFMLFWAQGRRGVRKNLDVILPEGRGLRNWVRTYRVFRNFAWTLADAVRFQEARVIPDWEFAGYDHFMNLIHNPEGAIVLTAHMGSYDLGSYLFSEKLKRPITIIRAPEDDLDTKSFEDQARDRTLSDQIRVEYNSGSSQLAIDLIHAIRAGQIVAIQGDRVTEGLSTLAIRLFNRTLRIPSGPFALSMATGAQIYPLFVICLGRRRYRIITGSAFRCVRTGRDRETALQRAADEWAAHLETMLRDYWFQWFEFEPQFTEESP